MIMKLTLLWHFTVYSIEPFDKHEFNSTIISIDLLHSARSFVLVLWVEKLDGMRGWNMRVGARSKKAHAECLFVYKK